MNPHDVVTVGGWLIVLFIAATWTAWKIWITLHESYEEIYLDPTGMEDWADASESYAERARRVTLERQIEQAERYL